MGGVKTEANISLLLAKRLTVQGMYAKLSFLDAHALCIYAVLFVFIPDLPEVFLEAVPLPSGRGVTVYISPPPYLAPAGLVISTKTTKIVNNQDLTRSC